MQAVILAAGKGTRMKSGVPKVLHCVLGKPLLAHVLEALKELRVSRCSVVLGSGAAQVRSFITQWSRVHHFPIQIVYQRRQLGTGHAVMKARSGLKPGDGTVLIWPGDMPLLKKETLLSLAAAHRREGAVISVLSSIQTNPQGYGRILRAGGRFFGIREELEATELEKRIQEINTAVYLFDRRTLLSVLKKIRANNKKKEYYLTDAVEILIGQGKKVRAFPLAASQEGQGVNSRRDLAEAIKIMKNREIENHMQKGVTFVSPEQTHVEKKVKIGRDTIVEPWCYIEQNVKIGKRCHIGPFAKIRSGSEIGDGSIIGNFVEVTRSKVGKKVLVKHLSYLGDAWIGDETNIGAGTVTANFDGKKKHQTRIGRKNLIGSNTVFVAPVTTAERVKTGAGTIIPRKQKSAKGETLVGVPARRIRKKR